MKTTLAVLIVMLCSKLAFSVGPALNCSDRSVDGYYLGMSSNQAIAVRGGETKLDGVIIAREPGKETTLRFEQAGHLSELEQVVTEVDPEVLMETLTAAWGSGFKDVYEKPTGVGVQPRLIRSVWTDPTCTQRVEVFFTYGPTSAACARVQLMRTSE